VAVTDPLFGEEVVLVNGLNLFNRDAAEHFPRRSRLSGRDGL
jgi:hypothetical protein